MLGGRAGAFFVAYPGFAQKQKPLRSSGGLGHEPEVPRLDDGSDLDFAISERGGQATGVSDGSLERGRADHDEGRYELVFTRVGTAGDAAVTGHALEARTARAAMQARAIQEYALSQAALHERAHALDDVLARRSASLHVGVDLVHDHEAHDVSPLRGSAPFTS
jgi:hypothetical protein